MSDDLLRRLKDGATTKRGADELIMESFDEVVALTARLAILEAAIKRQAGASKTLRDHTLAEVRHLRDMDRSEYNAAKSLDSEREANALLTEQLQDAEDRANAFATKEMHTNSRAMKAEAALATARDDALEAAALLAETTTAAPAQYNAKDRWRAEIGREVAAAIRSMKGATT